METLNKNKLWALILMLLVIANLATLGIFWYVKVKDKPVQDQNDHTGSTFDFVVKQVRFDAKQQEAYAGLIHAHQKEAHANRDQLRIAKDDLFNMLGDAVVSQTKVDSIAGVVGKLEKDLDIKTFNHFQQVRALCTTAQKVKFDNIIRQIMRMMGPTPPGRPSGPPQGRGANGDFRPPPPPDGQGPPPDRQGPPPQ